MVTEKPHAFIRNDLKYANHKIKAAAYNIFHSILRYGAFFRNKELIYIPNGTRAKAYSSEDQIQSIANDWLATLWQLMQIAWARAKLTGGHGRRETLGALHVFRKGRVL